MFFFFQAEDGIRDLTVTGVQTCALPICQIVPQSSFDFFAAARAYWVLGRNADAASLAREGVWRARNGQAAGRSEEHTSELQSQSNLVCRLLLEKKKKNIVDV